MLLFVCEIVWKRFLAKICHSGQGTGDAAAFDIYTCVCIVLHPQLHQRSGHCCPAYAYEQTDDEAKFTVDEQNRVCPQLLRPYSEFVAKIFWMIKRKTIGFNVPSNSVSCCSALYLKSTLLSSADCPTNAPKPPLRYTWADQHAARQQIPHQQRGRSAAHQ